MKVILKVFEYKETLEQEFTSAEEANEIVDLISKNYPQLRFEPYIEVDENLIQPAPIYEETEVLGNEQGVA